MNITITGRHINVSENLGNYAEKKIKKLETYFDQLIDAKVILYLEKLDHGSEVIINGDGVQFHGREKAADFFSSIDLLFEKMERQIVRYKEKHSSHKAVNPQKNVSLGVTTDEGLQLNLNQVSNKPIDRIEAYLQMKVDDQDFILFKQGISKVDSDIDFSNKNYAILFRSNDDYKMVEIPFDKIKEEKAELNNLIEYNLDIVSDSHSDPKIKFKNNKSCSVKTYTIGDAIQEFDDLNTDFLPFFNIESQYFNVLFMNGKEYELMVPAF